MEVDTLDDVQFGCRMWRHTRTVCHQVHKQLKAVEEREDQEVDARIRALEVRKAHRESDA